MDPRLATLITGTLTSGAMLSLIAIGFVIMYRATKVVSFAQGAFSLIGSVVFLELVNHHLGLYPSILLTIVITAVIGAATYQIVFSRIVGSEPFITAIATIGLGTALLACAIMIWGSGTILLPAVISGSAYRVWGSLAVTPTDIFIVMAAIVVFAVLITALYRTRLGLRVLAVADAPLLAAYAGVNVVAISALAWAVSSSTAAVGGIAYIMTSQPDANAVFSLGLVVFPAILLGGLDSIVGALVGSVVLAFVQNFVAAYGDGSWSDIASYGLLLAVLLVRPQGLFGSAEVSRV